MNRICPNPDPWPLPAAAEIDLDGIVLASRPLAERGGSLDILARRHRAARPSLTLYSLALGGRWR